MAEESQTIEYQDRLLQIEEAKLAIEREKLAVEREKLQKNVEIENNKAKWLALGAGVPVVVAILTVAFGIFSLHRNSQNAFISQSRRTCPCGRR